ncbi:helix-turn-helix transcriptional regulator [Alkaliphilus peptidifermentans]|uniref:Predicted DNA-binding transcriptional regulator YafY, contains an HTH and WYL domains n=1 Tax=Alkaliphilus peptidifermentans DSM 18978 TaxID=1120976 RepID=A0A1G5FVK6_9FIRM|nr:YafY family protein [Alkaliphilus peptidifermentans]SCY43362.1 Predicted DNA-binding transcriptional regulator YafY, contains an HTH and WYL domains [Alkaliphilus peptidifermentans DSM 18978]
MRVDRLLSIILIIAKKRLVTGKDLAEHFEVSLRTIYRDIDKICEAGIPIASYGGKGGGYYIMENYSLDNLFFDKEEVQALMTVMNSINILFGRNQQFNDIVMKFEHLNKEDLKHDKLSINLSHFSMEEELKEYLSLMNKAIEKNRLLIFDYVNRKMEYLERTVEPIRITYSHGEWYLTGFCRIRNNLRNFKLVRIRNIKLGEGFNKKEIDNETIDRILTEGYENRSIKVVMKFTNKIGLQLSEYFPKKSITQDEENNYVVEELYPYEEGLLKYILSFGKECEVIEPDYLRGELKNYLLDILKKYQD